MEIDQALTDKIADLKQTRFEGSVFRAAGKSFDPLAASMNGGRWAPRPNDEPGFAVLYTSRTKEGALAEIVSYLALQTPLPSKPLFVHEIEITASKTITLAWADLSELGVNQEHYGHRNYARTQEIGTAINYMGLDGLISPSARWDCENLTLFMDNHALEEKLKAVKKEEISWREWAADNGFLEPFRPNLNQFDGPYSFIQGGAWRGAMHPHRASRATLLGRLYGPPQPRARSARPARARTRAGFLFALALLPLLCDAVHRLAKGAAREQK